MRKLLDLILYKRSGVCLLCGEDLEDHNDFEMALWDHHSPIEEIQLRPLFQWFVDFYRASQQFGDGFEGFLKQHYILTVLLITLSFACIALIVYEVLGG